MEKMLQAGKRILKRLNDSGFEAYFVGGYVRDLLLARNSSDIDIATNALPSDVEKLFEKTIPTGKKYGTITIRLAGYSFEVTTYRRDQNYRNHRQPESVHFSTSLKDDLIRRDFTMNAIAEDINGIRVDLFKGQKDISNKIIRAIDDPNKRFKEDALRILRAIRFVGKLGFKIEKKTLVAMKNDAYLLGKISIERIVKELELILKQPHIHEVYKILDEIHFGDVFPELDQAIHLLKNARKNHQIEEVFALGIYPLMHLDKEKWRLSKKQVWMIEEILSMMHILEHQMINPTIAFQHDQSIALIADDLLASYFSNPSQKTRIKDLYQALTIHSIKDLSINGQMIVPMVKKKKDVGRIIDALIEAILYNRIENKQNDLLNYARNLAEALNETK